MELKLSKSGKVWIFRNFSNRYEQSWTTTGHETGGVKVSIANKLIVGAG